MSGEWKIVYTADALKDKEKAYEAGFKEKIKTLLNVLKQDPFIAYPPYEKLIGNLSGAYSRRINRQHRFVYYVHKSEMTIKIISLWNHYE